MKSFEIQLSSWPLLFLALDLNPWELEFLLEYFSFCARSRLSTTWYVWGVISVIRHQDFFSLEVIELLQLLTDAPEQISSTVCKITSPGWSEFELYQLMVNIFWLLLVLLLSHPHTCADVTIRFIWESFSGAWIDRVVTARDRRILIFHCVLEPVLFHQR